MFSFSGSCSLKLTCPQRRIFWYHGAAGEEDCAAATAGSTVPVTRKFLREISIGRLYCKRRREGEAASYRWSSGCARPPKGGLRRLFRLGLTPPPGVDGGAGAAGTSAGTSARATKKGSPG